MKSTRHYTTSCKASYATKNHWRQWYLNITGQTAPDNVIVQRSIEQAIVSLCGYRLNYHTSNEIGALWIDISTTSASKLWTTIATAWHIWILANSLPCCAWHSMILVLCWNQQQSNATHSGYSTTANTNWPHQSNNVFWWWQANIYNPRWAIK